MLENSITLRPLRLVELLDAAFRIYRRNFLTFIGIMAIMQIPVSLLTLGSSVVMLQGMGSILGTGGLPNAQYFLGMGSTFLLAIISFFLISGLATAALTRAIAASSLGGRLGVFDAYRKLGSSVVNLLLSMLLAGLIIIGLCIWLLIPCVGWFSGLGMILYFGFVIMQLLVPVVVLEKRGPLDALRRVWELARRRFWWLLGLAGVLYLLNLVLVGPAGLATYLLQQFTLRGGINSMDYVTSTTISTVIQSLVTLLVSLIYRPLELSVIVLTYFDLRVRSEGFDLALQSMSSTEYPDPVDGIAAAPATPPQKSLITGMELGYFVAGTLGGFLLLTLVYGLLAIIGFGVTSFLMGSGL